MRIRAGFVIAAALFVSSSAWARGGGGCVEAGTPVLTPGGPVPVERLVPGDAVLTLEGCRLSSATVSACFAVEPNEYIELRAEGRTLRVTPEHPVAIAPGVFRMASWLRPGDTVRIVENGLPRDVALSSVSRVKATRPAYNLLVFPGGTFVAGGASTPRVFGGGDFVLHNKGCFLPDTPILRADGSSVRIRDVKPGDELLAFTPDEQVTRTTVRSIVRREVDEYARVDVGGVTLSVTPEHPFYAGEGTFRTIESLHPGDAVFVLDGRGLAKRDIVSITRVRARVTVYNLQTDDPHTYFAAGVAVHNKGGGGGCFPAGTLVRTPGGDRAIETLEPGDAVLSVDPRGHLACTGIESVTVTHDEIFIVETGRGALFTTREHPVRMVDGSFRSASWLKPGDLITRLDGGELTLATVLSTRGSGDEEEVYNLTVEAPHTFVADGFVVHNKGGGGGRFIDFIPGDPQDSIGMTGLKFLGNLALNILLYFGVIIVLGCISWAWDRLVHGRHPDRDENLDHLYNRSAIEKKAQKTEKLLDFIAKTDPLFEKTALENGATSTFLKLQECWQARDYGPMKALLMPDIYAEHCEQIEGQKRDHEINRMDGLAVESVDIVNVRYTNKPDQREFTALITASARDYYVDDRDQSVLCGDDEPARFQEFWTFHLVDGKWLLREIQQTGESDLLKEDNFFEPMTDQGVEEIYGDRAKQAGPAGPWLEKGTEAKATKIERMLNFLVQTDKLWDRPAMTETARKAFLGVFLARESGHETKVPRDLLFPNLADALATEIAYQAQMGNRIEFRNLCVRKVELILVRNFEDNSKDEFTTRITAHAQVIATRGGAVIAKQDYVTAFEEYWTFGRLDNAWKLKEVEPHAEGEGKIEAENVDQDSTPSQLQWYYRQPRAN